MLSLVILFTYGVQPMLLVVLLLMNVSWQYVVLGYIVGERSVVYKRCAANVYVDNTVDEGSAANVVVGVIVDK